MLGGSTFSAQPTSSSTIQTPDGVLSPIFSLFQISKHRFASYHKTLGKGLGLGIVSEKPYLQIVGLVLPHIKERLDEMCHEVEAQMQDISSDTLGSWDRAVTTCDGCWQIRGHFSQNCTFVIKSHNHWKF